MVEEPGVEALSGTSPVNSGSGTLGYAIIVATIVGVILIFLIPWLIKRFKDRVGRGPEMRP